MLLCSQFTWAHREDWAAQVEPVEEKGDSPFLGGPTMGAATEAERRAGAGRAGSGQAGLGA